MDSSTRPSRRRAPALAALLVALALVGAACGGSDADSATGSATDAASGGAEATASLFTGEATTVGGESFDLSTLAGQDLIVWFWAPW
jgi:cytochrome oxidase Cu insertion factor (SCO1/SenC/PrrC family)